MESPYKEILIFVFGGGFITAIIAVAKEIRERVAAKKQQQKDERDTDLSQAAELRRIDKESDSAAWGRTTEALKLCGEDNQRLRDELEKKQSQSSLSGETITRLYSNFRKTGREISRLEGKLNRGDTLDEIAAQIEVVKNCFEETEKLLPQ